VNVSAAIFFFGAPQQAIGQVLERQSNTRAIRCNVVAVVADAKFWTLAQDPPSTVYRPSRQTPPGPRAYMVRGESQQELERAMSTVIGPLIPDAPMPQATALGELMLRTIALERAIGWLSASLATLSLLLTCLSLFGQVTWSVTRRMYEFGVRVAIGATTGNIVHLIVKRVTRTVVSGIAIGIVGSWMASTIVRAFLHKTDPLAVPLLAGAALLVALTAVLATLGPARRAALVDPAVAQRAQ
jgi:uncharacterized membrane protein YeaQ/YmgE (transglycosylase-associated protein family)